jgi:MoaA/NifB/PqqE/SkfB family radical SAM enzyme
LSGGDPFLYPHFWGVYDALVFAGVRVSILDNPISSADLQRLLSYRAPSYFQVSLEGLREHNDDIRGRGHFDHTMEFLKRARHIGLETHVMLTLTRANLDQVIPLGTA